MIPPGHNFRMNRQKKEGLDGTDTKFMECAKKHENEF